MFVMIAIAVWACALVIWWICSNAFRHSDLDKLKSRLIGTTKSKTAKAATSGGSLIQSEEKNVLLATKFLRRFQLQSKLQEMLEQAGMKWSTHRLVNTCLVAVVAVWALAWVLLPDQLRRYSYVPALAAGALPVLYVIRKRTARLRRFEELFPDSLEFVSRSMRAGHAFSVSLEMIHREFQEPLSGEFRRTFEEHNLGLPLDVALQKLAKRVPLARRALLRFRGIAAKAHGRQPGRDSGQTSLRDPGALQAAGPHPRHQRAWADDGHRSQLHSHWRWRC